MHNQASELTRRFRETVLRISRLLTFTANTCYLPDYVYGASSKYCVGYLLGRHVYLKASRYSPGKRLSLSHYYQHYYT